MDSIDNALNQIGFGRFHFYFVVVMACQSGIFDFQLVTITLLGPALSCYWKINATEVFTFNTIIFSGMIIGSLTLGKFSDKYGRKTVLILSNCLFSYCIFLSAISQDIYWLTVFQFIIGIFSVGIPITTSAFFFEWCPMKYRIVYIAVNTTIIGFGCQIETLLGYVIIPRFGWRVFILITAILIIFLALFLIPVPESARYLMLNKGKSDCLRVINIVAKWNRAETIKDIQEPPVTKSNIKDLMHPNYLLTTILVSFISLVNYFTYFCIILVIPIIANIPHRCLQNWNRFSTVQSHQNSTAIDDSCCMELSLENYKNMLISASAELIFIPFYIILISFIGRKKTITIFLFLIATGIFLLNFCLNSLQLNILLFIIRGISSMNINLIIMYASKIFPTSVRGFGMGICSAAGRIGMAMSPLIVNIVIYKYSMLIGSMIILGVNFTCFCVSFLLPYETRDRNLHETAKN